MEISPDTSFYINIGTLISIGFFLWKLSATISKTQKEVEMQLKDHDERIKTLEELDLKRILTEIQTNLKRIMKKMEEE